MPGLSEFDGGVRLYRWPAPFRLPGRTDGQALTRKGWDRCCFASPRVGVIRGMKAMILAAGLGTRLRPLTNNRPKALVEIDGRTPLEITLSRLRSFGISEVIINVHHFADMIVDYLAAKQNFGMQIEISREDVLLDTG